jgi:hypothetical protein
VRRTFGAHDCERHQAGSRCPCGHLVQALLNRRALADSDVIEVVEQRVEPLGVVPALAKLLDRAGPKAVPIDEHRLGPGKTARTPRLS